MVFVSYLWWIFLFCLLETSKNLNCCTTIQVKFADSFLNEFHILFRCPGSFCSSRWPNLQVLSWLPVPEDTGWILGWTLPEPGRNLETAAEIHCQDSWWLWVWKVKHGGAGMGGGREVLWILELKSGEASSSFRTFQHFHAEYSMENYHWRYLCLWWS